MEATLILTVGFMNLKLYKAFYKVWIKYIFIKKKLIKDYKLMKLLRKIPCDNGQSVCDEAKNHKINLLDYITDFVMKTCHV